MAKSSPSVFMPRFSAFLLSLLALGSHGAAVAAVEAKTRPNVLLIVSDDQGFSDFGFTGNPLVKTPVLDRLAAESAVFKNFVVAAACPPPRPALSPGRVHRSPGVRGVPPGVHHRPDEARRPAAAAIGCFLRVNMDTVPRTPNLPRVLSPIIPLSARRPRRTA